MGREIITIDGPSASGKSTIARRLASALGFVYVDSGSLYRGVTWKALQEGIDCSDVAAVSEFVGSVAPEFFVSEGAMGFRIATVIPGEALRSGEIDEHVSPVSAVPAVRKKVVGWLRGLAGLGSLVIEGRDIGTAVFPEARYKFYLDASAEERARRRHEEMLARDVEPGGDAPPSVTDVQSSLQRRDRIDSTRKMDPLRVAEDAVVLNSTGMEIGEVVEMVLGHLDELTRAG